MYRIKLDGIVLRIELEVDDSVYWQSRLAKMFPHSTIEIIRA